MNLVDVNLERSVLGAIMIKPGANDNLIDTLRPGDFSDVNLRAVYTQMAIAKASGAVIDTRFVSSLCHAVGIKEGFVSSLLDAVASHKGAHSYARRLRDLGGRREAAAIDPSAIVESTESLSEALAEMRQRLDAIEAGRVRGHVTDLGELAKMSFDAMERRRAGTEPPGLSTGCERLDELLQGLRRQGLYIVAGNTSCGKSSMAGSIFLHAAVSTDYRARLYTLEMGKRDLTDRLICSMARVNALKFQNGKALEESDLPRLMRAFSDLSAAWSRGSIGDLPISIADLYTEVKQAHVQAPIDYVIVDYLQLVKSSRRQFDNREQQVAEIARGLKNIAMDINCVVIGVSQVNRDSERRVEKRPRLSDLRESGELEQAADGVIMLHREEDANGNKSEETDVFVRKHRHGPLGSVRLRFVGEHYRFESWP